MDDFEQSPPEFRERELEQDPAHAPAPEPRLEQELYARGFYTEFDHRERVAGWQRTMLRRLAALLCTGTLAFTLTTWVLVQRERAALPALAVPSGEPPETGGAPPAATGEPAQAARAQLDALNRGDIREAYELFSPQYRKTVPFDAFKALVTSHRAMFRTEEEEMSSVTVAPDRVRVDLHVQSDNDEHYIARYTLARIDGRWWVDDLRWVNADNGDEDVSSA